jgi:hypothetical protein
VIVGSGVVKRRWFTRLVGAEIRAVAVEGIVDVGNYDGAVDERSIQYMNTRSAQDLFM